MNNGLIRCAVIGAGLLGSDHVQFLAKQVKKAKVVAVADVRFEAAEKVAVPVSARPYADYTEMLGREQLDLVIVATPDNLHMDPALAAIKAGVPNLCMQKPLATISTDAQAILNAANESKTRIFVWYANRCYGTDMATQYAISSGLVGRIVYGDCMTDDNIGVPLVMWGDRTKEWVGSSSPANFLTTHTVDRLLWYMAPAKVDKVFAIEQHEVLGYTYDLFDAFLYFDNGAKVRAKSGWIHFVEGGVESAEQFNGFDGQVINNRGARFNVSAGWKVALRNEVPFEELRHHQEALRKRGLGSRIIWREPLNTGWNRGITCGLEIAQPEAPNREILEFVLDGILENTDTPESWKAWQGDGPLPMADIAMHNVHVIEAIYQSVKTGLPVSLNN